MRRLLQGDVGSGKTLVGALSALHANSNGWQTALLCPTEILAEQHFNPSKHGSTWVSKLNYLQDLQKLRIKQRRSCQRRDILIGTHAIFQSGVDFNRLGLTIIDEQHRFGVHQRFSMLEKVKSNLVLIN